MRRRIWGIIGCCTSLLMATQVALAQSTPLPPLQITVGTTPQAGDLAIPLQILLLLTLLSGRVPIFPVRLPAEQGVKWPYVSTCSTAPPCSTTATGVWPRHWRDTKRGSALSSAG